MNIKFKRGKEMVELIEAFRGPNSEMAVDTFFDMMEPVLDRIVEGKVKHIIDENAELKRSLNRN